MTSVTYYLNWLRETGRGHLLALVSWGGVGIYLCSMLFGLQLDTEYTFFENTVRFLQEHHVTPEKQLADYPVQTIIVKETYPVSQSGLTSRGAMVHSYQEQEEIDTWKAKLIPQLFDIQPLFAPMDYSVDADAEVEEEETASYLSVECYGRYSGAE